MSTGKYKKYAAGQAEKDSERKAIEPLTKKERRNVKAARIFKHSDVAGTTTARKNANTNTETLNGFKAGVSRLPSCRGKDQVCGDKRAVLS